MNLLSDLPKKKIDKVELFCVNKMLNDFNKLNNVSRRMCHFYRKGYYNSKIKELSEKNNGYDNVIVTHRGKYGGTWMNEELVYIFYNWLNRIKPTPMTRDELKLDRIYRDVFYDILKYETQYPCLNYKVDFYFPSLNLAVEFDESHHSKQIKNDNSRQAEIQNKLKCDFIRVKKNQELQSVACIFKHYLLSFH